MSTMAAKKCLTSRSKNFEMVMLPQDKESHYQSLTGKRDNRSSNYTTVNIEQGHLPVIVESVSKMALDTVVCLDQQPPLPSRSPADFDYCKPSESQGPHHSSDELKAGRKCGDKKFLLIIIFGAIVAIALLISIVALYLGAFSSNRSKDIGIEQNTAEESVQNNSLVISALVSRIKFLEQSLQQSQINQENYSTLFEISNNVLATKLDKIENKLVSNISSVQSRLDSIFATTSSRLITAENQLRTTSSGFDSRLTSAENQLRSTSSSLTTVRSQLTSTENQLRSTSSDLSSLKSNLRRTNLFRRCFQDENTCRVSQHSSNSRWYRCITGSQYINRSVSSLF